MGAQLGWAALAPAPSAAGVLPCPFLHPFGLPPSSVTGHSPRSGQLGDYLSLVKP